jgi:ABC-type uncharacterized transport system auxiliary subunit
MKKLLCILATAALFGACEQKTEVTAPAAPPTKQTPDPAKAQRLNRKTGPVAPANTDATTTTETKTESSTTVTATPNP